MKEIGEAKQIEEYLFHLEGRPISQAKAIKDLIEGGMTQREIGGLMDRSQQEISARLRLLDLHPDLQERAERGEIRKSAARRLAGMPLEEQERFLDREKILVKDVERECRRLALTAEVMEVLNAPLFGEDPDPADTVRCPRCGHEFALPHCSKSDIIEEETEEGECADEG